MGTDVKRYLFDTNIHIYYFADVLLKGEIASIE